MEPPNHQRNKDEVTIYIDSLIKEKINNPLVRDIFSIPNKNYLYKSDIKRELEFFFPENFKQIFQENNFSPI